jgi:tetratricopeptide (TPR) repeat protein
MSDDEADAVLALDAAIQLGLEGKDAAALAAFDDFLARFRDIPGPRMPSLVSLACFNRGRALAALGRDEAALAAFAALLATFAADADIEIGRRCAAAMSIIAQLLGRLGREDEALAACDRLIAQYSRDPDAGLRQNVSSALLDKAGLLVGRGGRRNGWKASRIYRTIIRRYGRDPAAAVRIHAAKALVNRGGYLADRGQRRAAIVDFETVLQRYGDEPDPAFAEVCASALHNQGVELLRLGQTDAALRSYDDLLGRFGQGTAPGLRPVVARTLLGQAQGLAAQGRYDEAFRACTTLLEEYGRDLEPRIREDVQSGRDVRDRLRAEWGAASEDRAQPTARPGTLLPASGETSADGSATGWAEASQEDALDRSRDFLVALAMKSLAEHCVQHDDFGTAKVSAAAVVRRTDEPSLKLTLQWAGEPEPTHDKQLDAWLKGELTADSRDVVMVGWATTTRARVDRDSTLDAVRFEFEDGSGRFRQSIRPFRVDDGKVVWGEVRTGFGFDRTPRVWPGPVRRSWPTPGPEADALQAQIEQARQEITTYLETGASLFGLDDGIEVLGGLRSAYEVPEDLDGALALDLGRGTLARHLRIGDPTDIAAAVDVLRQLHSSEACPAELRSDVAVNLINALLADYERSADPLCLDEAVEVGTARLDMVGGIPLNDPFVAATLGWVSIIR